MIKRIEMRNSETGERAIIRTHINADNSVDASIERQGAPVYMNYRFNSLSDAVAWLHDEIDQAVDMNFHIVEKGS